MEEDGCHTIHNQVCGWCHDEPSSKHQVLTDTIDYISHFIVRYSRLIM